jgi:hypothetical protein
MTVAKNIFLFLFLIIYCTACVYAQGWSIQTVDTPSSGGKMGLSSSIKVDANGRPHISYLNYFSSYDTDLKYAEWNGVNWSTQTVDNAFVGDSSSLVLDANGNPSISYGGQDGLRYAIQNNSAWLIQTIDSGTCQSTSLALNSLGQPSILAWHAATPFALHYWSWNGSNWSSSFVPGPLNSYSLDQTSLVFDNNGKPRLTYRGNDGYNTYLMYGQQNGSTWSYQIVDEVHPWGSYASLAIDGLGLSHASYVNSSFDLTYATLNGSVWSTEVVDNSGAMRSTSLQLDALGHPHISYNDFNHGTLKYASFDGSTWSIQTVDNIGTIGGHPSLALDASGRAYISYYDSTTQSLRCAIMVPEPSIFVLFGNCVISLFVFACRRQK